MALVCLPFILEVSVILNVFSTKLKQNMYGTFSVENTKFEGWILLFKRQNSFLKSVSIAKIPVGSKENYSSSPFS